MTQREVFPNPPIMEALLDIRATLPPEITLERLATLHDGVKDLYPRKEERPRWEFRTEFKKDVPPTLEQTGGPDGYSFKSADGLRIFQARLDGFTLNKLKPYDRWETLRDEAKRLWALYAEMAGPQAVTRVALRYINRIEIPVPFDDFKDYILTVPEIAKGLPQGLANFFMRLIIPDQSRQALAIVTLTIDMEDPRQSGTDRLPLIFDIDVIREATFVPLGPDVWEALENLHDLKNDVFFRSITEKCKTLFRGA